MPKIANLVRKLQDTWEVCLRFTFQRSDVCVQQITNDYCSLISLISLFWLEHDQKKTKGAPWQLQSNLLLIKNSHRRTYSYRDLLPIRIFIIQWNYYNPLTIKLAHKRQVFLVFLCTQLKIILKVWMAIETFLSKVHVSIKNRMQKKTHYNREEKYDKSHEQSHCSPCIIRKKSRQSIFSSHSRQMAIFSATILQQSKQLICHLELSIQGLEQYFYNS